MKIFNRGERAIIVAKKDIISGDGRPTKVEGGEDKGYINPQTKVDVVDAVAKKLLKMYPKELISWGD